MMLATSTAVTVFVINIHYRGVNGQSVPSYIRIMILKWLAWLLRLNDVVDRKLSPITNRKKVRNIYIRHSHVNTHIHIVLIDIM